MLFTHEVSVICVGDIVLWPLQDWAQGEIFPLWEVQSVFSPGSAGKPQGDYYPAPVSHSYTSYALFDELMILLIVIYYFFYVSVCWKCFKAELPSVYGGNRTYNTLGDSMARDVGFLCNALLSVQFDMSFFCTYRTFTHPELELTFFHAAIFYTSMAHYSLNTTTSGLWDWIVRTLLFICIPTLITLQDKYMNLGHLSDRLITVHVLKISVVSVN